MLSAALLFTLALGVNAECRTWCNRYTSGRSQCSTCEPHEACAPWCNAFTCGSSFCSECETCAVVETHDHCSAWCNSYTCGGWFFVDYCSGCAFCSPPPEDPCACVPTDLEYGVISGVSTLMDPTYGDFCQPNDMTTETCQPGGNSEGDDWCSDNWCYVNPETCDKPTYLSSYFPGANLWFSYKACDAAFMGNGWVGECECTGNGGLPGTGGNTNAPNYGGSVTGTTTRGCNAWDGEEDYCQAGGTYFTGNPPAAADWCEDAWCYVDPTRCDVQAYHSEFLPGSSLHFSYKTCDRAGFTSNTFIAGTTPSNVPPLPAVP